MRVLATIPEVRAALAQPRRDGSTLGLVPTMGAFHEGHLSLMRRAREECDVVVVSLFVNPAQFNDPADLTAYPRDAGRDAALAAELGVDYLFAPAAEEVYPPGFATTVSVRDVTETLEGAHRGRGHFDGVATVVTKLFNIVGPDVAYFGQKDAQQATVIKRLVARPRPAGPDRGLPHRPRAGRARPVQPERPSVAGRARPRQRASPGARRDATSGRRRRARSRRRSAPTRSPNSVPPRSNRITSSSSRPPPSPP